MKMSRVVVHATSVTSCVLAAGLSAAIATASIARAHPDLDRAFAQEVCYELRYHPTGSQIEVLGQRLIGKGMEPEHAAQVVYFAIVDMCPDMMPVLNEYRENIKAGVKYGQTI